MRETKSANTKPEMVVRRLVYSMGYRFRLHRKDLPGKPDLVFGLRRKAIFVHGCFWHQHADCSAGRLPASNTDYWQQKLQRNVERDARARSQSLDSGWSSLTIRDCETKNVDALRSRLDAFLVGGINRKGIDQ